MKCSNSIVELLVTLLQLMSFIAICYFYGFLIALLLSIVTYVLFYLYTVKFLELYPLSTSDKILLGDTFFKRQQILTQLKFNNFSAERMFEAIKERAFYNLPKLSAVLVYKYFNFYWKKSDKPLNEIISQRIKILQPMSKQEIEDYKLSELHRDLDMFECPIEFHIIPCSESKIKDKYEEGYVFVKNDHSLTDGLGIISLMFSMGENFSPSVFPKIMFVRKDTIFDLIFNFFLFLIIGIPIILYLTFYVKSTCKLSTKARTNKIALTKTVTLDFIALKKRSKELKMSINEICLSSFLASIKKNRQDKEQITVEIPIGLSPVPKNISEVVLANHVFALFQKFRLLTDPLKDYNLFKEDYTSLLKQAYAAKISHIASAVLFSILPFNISKDIIVDMVHEVDITISNLPGTTENIIVNGNKCIEALPYTTTGNINNAVVILSYGGKINTNCMYDAGQDANLQAIIDEYEKNMNRIIYDDEYVSKFNNINANINLLGKELETDTDLKNEFFQMSNDKNSFTFKNKDEITKKEKNISNLENSLNI